MSPTPIALPPALPSELLEYILTQQTHPTTVLICTLRPTFLSSLSKAIARTLPSAPSPSSPPANSSPSPPENAPEELPQRHTLLIPTLRQIATSRHINLVFLPTITHLRAYLALFPDPEKEGPPRKEWGKPGSKEKGLLVVYGVVGLHRYTSEWSAQGLGNSLAGVVEVGSSIRRRVVVIEERSVEEDAEERMEMAVDEDGEERSEMAVDGEGHDGRGGKVQVWKERVPMLNGSVRRAGFESEEGEWSGRTVEVGRILARWFRFKKANWDSREPA